MYFEINVSKYEKSTGYGSDGYRHYFATSERSITRSEQAAKLIEDFKERFPAPEFNISVSFNPQRYWGLEIGENVTDIEAAMSDLANNALK